MFNDVSCLEFNCVICFGRYDESCTNKTAETKLHAWCVHGAQGNQQCFHSHLTVMIHHSYVSSDDCSAVHTV